MERMGFEPETGSTSYFLTLYSVFVILKISEYDTWKPFCIFICSLGQNFKAFLHIRAMNIQVVKEITHPLEIFFLGFGRPV
jgi:hypothetical protein